jgi:hypothetical protein
VKALDEVSKTPPRYPAWMDTLGSDRRPGELRRLQSAMRPAAAATAGTSTVPKPKRASKAKSKPKSKKAAGKKRR